MRLPDFQLTNTPLAAMLIHTPDADFDASRPHARLSPLRYLRVINCQPPTVTVAFNWLIELES